MNYNCLNPVVDCATAMTCINADLVSIGTGSEYLTNFCSAVSKCVDSQFKLISEGGATTYNFFTQAVIKLLSSFPGYDSVGDVYLSSSDGVYSWISAASLGATYVASGTGITVTGSGTSGNPFKPNLNTAYTRGLFTGSNGIVYNNSTGLFKLGGALVEDTTILGGFFNFYLKDAKDFTVASKTARLDASPTITDQSLLTLDGSRVTFQQNNGTRASALDFNDTNRTATLATTENLIIQDGNGYDSSIVGTHKTFLKIANQHHATTLDVLSIINTITGEVGWRTVSGGGGSYTDEQAQDAVGSILISSSTIDFTYNDVTPSISASVKTGSLGIVTLENIPQGVVLGRGTAGAGAVEQIIVGGGLQISSGTLQLGVFTGDVQKLAGDNPLVITDNAVVDSKLRDSTGYSVIGRSTSSSGDPADIVAGVNGVLRRAGSTDVNFGTLVTGNIGDAQVTFAKVQNINTAKLVGRSTVGSGPMEELGTSSKITITGGVVDVRGRTLLGISKFTSSGTWVRPTGCNAVVVYTVGAGGGGAGANSASLETAVGSGGAAGGYSISYITTGLGATETITVGTGGTAGVVGSSYAGGNGGSSSFGAFTGAAGGFGGSTLASGTGVGMTAYTFGGNFTNNANTIVGGPGEYGNYGIRLAYTIGIGGLGGASIFGQRNGTANAPGAGGAGTLSNNNTDTDGTPGSDGIVIIYEFS